eukprot:902769-Pelagomonas_calceolata.AAC.3
MQASIWPAGVDVAAPVLAPASASAAGCAGCGLEGGIPCQQLDAAADAHGTDVCKAGARSAHRHKERKGSWVEPHPEAGSTGKKQELCRRECKQSGIAKEQHLVPNSPEGFSTKQSRGLKCLQRTKCTSVQGHLCI